MKQAKELYMYALGALFMIGYFSLIGFVLTRIIPAENKEIALMLFGTLTAGVSLILGYFYGSSKGSADKTEIMNKNKEL